MKYILLFAIFFSFSASAQMKGDTTKPPSEFKQIVFLMQENMLLSERLDRAEKRIDSLERRPYLFIDNKGVRPGVILTNSAGEYQILIAPLK